MDPWAESTGSAVPPTGRRPDDDGDHARFSTARIADMIHVMSDGQVIERGSHDELISAGGRYAEGWSAQAHP